MRRGVRFIDGREFLLAGRSNDQEYARSQAHIMRGYWTLVRVIKLDELNYAIYVHGAK